MKVYKHIIFDLDQTIWDFETNCAETLAELYDQFDLQKMGRGITKAHFINTYIAVNKVMWTQFHQGIVSKETIRNKRFEITFEKLGIPSAEIPPAINELYLKICPTKNNLVPYAKDLLQYLYSKYTLHVLTNGFQESQRVKIQSSKIDRFFKEIIHSDSCGYLKPDKRVFEYTLYRLNTHSSDCIMIGDDLEVDVLGAKNAGIDHIYFNPLHLKHDENITYEINCLSEIINIL